VQITYLKKMQMVTMNMIVLQILHSLIQRQENLLYIMYQDLVRMQ